MHCVGLKELIPLLKQLCQYNRVSECILITEFSGNKYNPMSSDAHIRGLFAECDGDMKRLNYPSQLPKVCYHFTSTRQPDFKVYRFRATPTAFKFDEELSATVRREKSEGEYGIYYRYSWPVNTKEDYDELGDIEL